MNDNVNKSRQLLNYINYIFGNDDEISKAKNKQEFIYTPGENEKIDSAFEEMNSFSSLENTTERFNKFVNSNIDLMKVAYPDLFPTTNQASTKKPVKVEPKSPEINSTAQTAPKQEAPIKQPIQQQPQPQKNVYSPKDNQLTNLIFETAERHFNEDIKSGRMKEENKPDMFNIVKRISTGMTDRSTGKEDFDIFDFIDNKNKVIKDIPKEYKDSTNHLINSIIKHYKPSKEEYEKLHDATINALSDQLYTKFKVDINNYDYILDVFDAVFDMAAERNMPIKQFALALGENLINMKEVADAVDNRDNPELLTLLSIINATLVKYLGQGASTGLNKERLDTSSEKIKQFYEEKKKELENENVEKSESELNFDEGLDLIFK
jgi:hypothetical protein